jgi:hypothetical protein
MDTPNPIPPVPPVETTTEPADIAIEALLADYLPKAKEASDASSRLSLLEELKGKISTIIEVLSGGPSVETPKPTPPKDPATDPVPPKDPASETTTPAAPSEEPPKKKDTTESVDVEKIVKPVLDVLESAGVTPNNVRIKALLAANPEDRKALAESWPKASAQQLVKPRSNSVLESTQTPKNTVVVPTADQIKDDAKLLNSGSRLM